MCNSFWSIQRCACCHPKLLHALFHVAVRINSQSSLENLFVISIFSEVIDQQSYECLQFVNNENNGFILSTFVHKVHKAVFQRSHDIWYQHPQDSNRQHVCWVMLDFHCSDNVIASAAIRMVLLQLVFCQVVVYQNVMPSCLMQFFSFETDAKDLPPSLIKEKSFRVRHIGSTT